MGDRPLTVCLIEDNPGDVRLIEEMLSDSDQLIDRLGSEERSFDGTTIFQESSLESGIERLARADVDVVLLDLGLPDSVGLETLTAVLEATESIPIVVLTGLNDGTIGIKAIRHGAQDFLVKDEVTSDLLVRSIHYALERNRQSRERERQRAQLAALNQLNEIGQAISHSVISMETREELERAVCQQLTDDDAYRFAWIGAFDRGAEQVTPRVSRGVERGYLEAVSADTAGTADTRHPAERAVQTREIQVVHDIRTDPSFGPGRDAALDRGYRSSAAVPIIYEEYLYGVLNIYAGSADAFSEPAATILARLGDIIGHAITAIDRRQILETDSVLELEFQVEGLATGLAARTADSECRVQVSNVIRTDDAVLGYGRAFGLSETTLRDSLTDASVIEELRVLSSGGESYSFEAVSRTIDSLVDAIATHGGRISSITIDEGSVRFVVVFAPGRDKRQLVDLVQRNCAGAVHSAQRLVDRTDGQATSSRSAFLDSLTEQQRNILETAYRGGLFTWPRESTETELADRLGISPPTFNQHLRAAEEKFFAEVFDEAQPDVPSSKR